MVQHVSKYTLTINPLYANDHTWVSRINSWNAAWNAKIVIGDLRGKRLVAEMRQTNRHDDWVHVILSDGTIESWDISDPVSYRKYLEVALPVKEDGQQHHSHPKG